MTSTDLNPDLKPALIQGIVDKWAAITGELEGERSTVPLRVLLGEAVDLAEVVDQHFATTTVNGKRRLGLESVVGVGGITGETSTELRELQLAVGAVHSRYLLLVEEASKAPVDDAEDIMSELRSVLGFVLGDGKHPTGEEQLSRLREAYEDAHSHDGMALALEGYGELANQYQSELQNLSGFDFSLVHKALQVAQALRQRSAEKLTGQTAQDQRDMMRLRNRLIEALHLRMLEVRRSIRFVFRDYPEIAAKAGSEYARSKQRRARRRTSEAPTSGITGTEDTMEVRTPGAGA